MSWKSRLKSIGAFTVKYVITLGAGALIDRYVTNKTVKQLLNAAVHQATVAPTLQGAIDKYIKEQGPTFDQEMAKMQDQLGSLLRRNASLSQQAAAARDRAGK